MDWNNAYADLPRSLSRGVVYFIAGSTTPYASHTFDDADTGVATFLYKATDCSVAPTGIYCDGGEKPVPAAYQPQNVAGWQARYGANAAAWLDLIQNDPEKPTGPIWQFCSGDYAIDGITGSVSSTGPGGQGFVFATQSNKPSAGIIHIGNQGCPDSPSGLSNISISHLEVRGAWPMPYYPTSIYGCTYASGTAAFSTTEPLMGVSGDLIDGWTSASALVFSSAKASIIGNNVSLTLSADPCPTLANAALAMEPAIGIWAVNHANFSETVSNLTIQDCYFHDLGEAVELWNGYSVAIVHNYLARNRSTPGQHTSIIQIDEGNAGITDGPISIAYNVIVDSTGTATISHLGLPFGCGVNCGTTAGLSVYGNVFTCASALNYKCGVGQATVSDNAGQSNIRQLAFYNNTMAGLAAKTGVLLLSAGSINADISDNLFYSVSGANAVAMQGGPGSTHDYNTALNSTISYGTTCHANETCISGSARDPFVSSATRNFHLASPMTAPAGSGTEAAQGISLAAPFNVDMDGVIRGSAGGWSRGAYQYVQKARPSGGLRFLPN